MAGENLSGIPPSVTLSGLNAGAEGGLSGTGPQGLSGGIGFGQTPFGMEGGPDLAQLLAALQGQGDVSAAAGSPLTAGVGQSAFGQQQGGLGAGAFGQQQPGYIAGQSAGGSAQSQAQGSADPFAMIQKLLGTAQKGLGAISAAGTASPTIGGSDLSLNGQLFQPEGGTGQIGTASPTIAQDMQGTLGSNYLQDPTLGGLFTRGQLNGWDGSPESLNALMASDPSIRDALLQGNVGGSLGEELGAGSGGAGGFTLGTGAGGGGGTDYLGAAGGAAGAGSGLLGILQGLQGGNAGQAAGGGLQTAGGLAQILKSSPELAQSLGITPEMLGGAGVGIQGLGAILNLLQGAQSGNPSQITQGGISAVSAANEASQALGGANYLGAAGSYIPLIGAVLQGLTADMSYKNADATAKQAMVGSALAAASAVLMSNPATAMFGPVLGVAMALNQALNPKTNYDLNKISGQVGPQGTAGVGQAGQAFAGLDIPTASNDSLMQAIVQGTNSIMPLYNTAGAGEGTSGSQTGVSRYIEGLKTADPAAYAAYQANRDQYESGVASAVQELLKRGVSYEQLGQLPVSQNWALDTLGINNPVNQLYGTNAAKFDTEAQALLNGALTRTAPQQYFNAQGEGGNWETLPEQYSIAGLGNVPAQFLDPQSLLQAALQGTGTAGSNAQERQTGMYGGPLWEALARMSSPTYGANVVPGSIQDIIQQHFDPWATTREAWGNSPESLGTSLMPILQSAAFQRAQ